MPGKDAPHRDLYLVPNAIHIGLFFEQGRVTVQGTLPEGCEPALIVRGEDQEEQMSIRGRRLGLWMTVGTATFRGAPTFYQCLTSKPISEMVSEKTGFENGLGFEKIKSEIDLELEHEAGAGEKEDRSWKDEFIQFKKESGLYSVEEGAVRVVGSRGGTEKVQGEIVLPARSPEGLYRVTLIGFRDGLPVARVEETLSVALRGPVEFLRDLAMEHGWIYGIMAVIVALTAGFGVGVLMPSRGAH
ncbi:MAG: TIGR02186 family protein [Thermodesulfobacteriota bacterium]